MPSHVMTVDVETWRDTEAVRRHRRSVARAARHEEGLDRLLDLFARYGVRATFFVLGKIAATRPERVRVIAGAGHQIGSHGFSHTPVKRMNPELLRRELMRTRGLLEDLTGAPVEAHRSPTWALSRSTLWALDVLADCGFRYDASARAGWTAGLGMVPAEPHRIRLRDGREIREFPAAVAAPWLPVPFAGGFFLRMLPRVFVDACFRGHDRRGVPVVVYSHPWEYDPHPPRVRLPLVWHVVHYGRLSRLPLRMESLVGGYTFAPLGEIAARIDWSRTPVWPVPPSS